MRIERGQIVVLSILVVLVVTFVGGLWLPRQQQIAEIERHIDAGELALEVLRIDNARDVSPPLDAGRIEAEIQLALPERADLGPLLERLSADLEGAGLEVSQLRARAAVKGKSVDQIPITLECSGTYSAVRELLQRLEGYDRLVRIDRLAVTGETVGVPDTTGTLNVDVELSTFRRVTEDTTS